MTAPKRKKKASVFQMPSVQTMVSRKSSITNAFVNAIIPVIEPSEAEVDEVLAIFGMLPTAMQCVYCGNPSSEWDHLRPLVVKLRPTGYISEIANLVPACGKCNQSKRNESWRTWMISTTAPLSPTSRGIADVAERMKRLEAFEKWREPTRIDFEAILGPKDWAGYWDMWERINADMVKCQTMANTLLKRVQQSLQKPG